MALLELAVARGRARNRGACGARWARQAAALRAAVHRSARSEAEGTRTRPYRDGNRALLRDGSRQALGSSRARLARLRDGRGTPAPSARAAVEAVLCRRARTTNSSSRRMIGSAASDGGRRPGYLFQFSRRSRAPVDRGPGLAGLPGLRPPALSADRLRLHDRIRSSLQPAAGFRSRRYPQYARRSAGSRRSAQSTHRRDRKVRARHLLSERRSRAALRSSRSAC